MSDAFAAGLKAGFDACIQWHKMMARDLIEGDPTAHKFHTNNVARLNDLLAAEMSYYRFLAVANGASLDDLAAKKNMQRIVETDDDLRRRLFSSRRNVQS